MNSDSTHRELGKKVDSTYQFFDKSSIWWIVFLQIFISPIHLGKTVQIFASQTWGLTGQVKNLYFCN